jgi:hypothetical protein
VYSLVVVVLAIVYGPFLDMLVRIRHCCQPTFKLQLDRGLDGNSRRWGGKCSIDWDSLHVMSTYPQSMLSPLYWFYCLPSCLPPWLVHVDWNALKVLVHMLTPLALVHQCIETWKKWGIEAYVNFAKTTLTIAYCPRLKLDFDGGKLAIARRLDSAVDEVASPSLPSIT